MSWNKTNSKSLEEKVARLKEANHELREQLKAKDEEIKRLKAERDHFHNKYIQVGEYIGEWIKGTKARSIVAMLFWEWKRQVRTYKSLSPYNTSSGAFSNYSANIAITAFNKAYKMLKDSK